MAKGLEAITRDVLKSPRAQRLYRSFPLCIFICLVLLLPPEASASDPSTPPALQKTAARAYAALKHRDFDAFLSLLSHDGSFYIALRHAVWTQKKKAPAGLSPEDDGLHRLDDLSPYGWEERDMEFDTEHEEGRADLRKALARFAKEVDNTMFGVGAALHQMDEWNERELGPSAAGKLASNAYWYLYFRKEGNRWTIWKLELAEH